VKDAQKIAVSSSNWSDGAIGKLFITKRAIGSSSMTGLPERCGALRSLCIMQASLGIQTVFSVKMMVS
jgi:hypothetical protein